MYKLHKIRAPGNTDESNILISILECVGCTKLEYLAPQTNLTA